MVNATHAHNYNISSYIKVANQGCTKIRFKAPLKTKNRVVLVPCAQNPHGSGKNKINLWVYGQYFYFNQSYLIIFNVYHCYGMIENIILIVF